MPTRYRDRWGWPRNQRAVIADEDGLRVERWVGRARHIPWGDVIGTRWMADGALVVDTLGGCVRVGRGAEALEEAVERFVGDAEGATGVAFGPSDVRRWLGGFHEATVKPLGTFEERYESKKPVYVLAMVVGVGLAMAAWEPITGLPLPGRGEPGEWVPVVMSLPVVALFMLVAAKLLGHLGPTVKHECRVAATTRTVTVLRRGRQTASFRWSTVVGVAERLGEMSIYLSDGRTVQIPDVPQFAQVINCLHAVIRRREGFHAAGTLVPDAALSPARITDSGDAERGLSAADAK